MKPGPPWAPGFVADVTMAATSTELLNTRLRNQLLVDSTRRKPEQVVSWLCAMQAQDFPAAKWAVASRAPGCQDGDVEQAFNDGLILRTHVLRPTWHFVTPKDIRWLLALSAPRIHAANDYYYRQADLDAKTFNKSLRDDSPRARGRPDVDARRNRRLPETRQDSGRRAQARLRDDARRARGGDLQRSAPRQAVYLRAAWTSACRRPSRSSATKRWPSSRRATSPVTVPRPRVISRGGPA